MKALILAAGMGTRIAPHVQGQQKCILPLADGTPLLRYTIALLLDHGIHSTVVTGYQGERVQQALAGLPVQFFHNPFFQVTSSTASYYFAIPGLDPNSDYLHIEADTFIEPELLRRFIALPLQEPLMLADLSRKQQADVKILCQNHYLTCYSKELAAPFDGEACDIYLLPAAVEQSLARQIHSEVLAGHYQQGWWNDVLMQHWKVRVVDTAGLFWQESDHYHEYQKILDYSSAQQQQLSPWLNRLAH